MLTFNNKDNRMVLKLQVLNNNHFQFNKIKIKKKINKINHLYLVKDYKIKHQFLVYNKVRTNNNLKLIVIKLV